jgi:hypothetical protein
LSRILICAKIEYFFYEPQRHRGHKGRERRKKEEEQKREYLKETAYSATLSRSGALSPISVPPNRQARKPAPSPPTNELHLIVGLGRVYGGYLLLGEIPVKEPLQNLPLSGFFHQKNIYLCKSPSAFICVYLRFQKKKKYMVGAGSPISLTTTDKS